MNRFNSLTKPLMWFMALLTVAFVAGCGGGGGSNGTVTSSAKSITAFSLAWTTGITPGTATGIVDETLKTIKVTVPYGTNLTPMYASFTTSGASVKVGTVTQVNGTTPNDFSVPVAYKVTAADGTWATYTVLVTVASNSAKAITAFSFVGYPGSTGTIDETLKTIAVTVPYGTNLTTLKATFSTTGILVTVGTAPVVTQVSGTTQNDFTNPVAYKVNAANLTTATYTVTVTVAQNTAKAITAFSFVGYPGISGAISGTTSPYAIAVTVPNGTVVTGLVATFTTTGNSVTVGATTQVSGTTTNDFTSPVAYTVHAADASTAIYNVTVTVSAVANPTAPTLGEAGRFVILASQGVTTTGTTGIVNGDIGIMDQARSFITGFTPNGSTGLFTELTGSTWSGMLSSSYAPDDVNATPYPAPLAYAPPHAAYATTLAMINQSRTDLGVAYNFLAAATNPGAPTQVCPTELGTLTLTPGVYMTASNVGITLGTLHLDAQGDPNAVWIFNISGTLTTGAPGGSIDFVGGVGQAKNVFWRVAGVTAIGAGTSFIGNVFNYATVNVNSGATIVGSLYSTTGSVTLIADSVTKAQ